MVKVLVAGATGQTGRRIVQQLTERGLAVKALVRDSGSESSEQKTSGSAFDAA